MTLLFSRRHVLTASLAALPGIQCVSPRRTVRQAPAPSSNLASSSPTPVALSPCETPSASAAPVASAPPAASAARLCGATEPNILGPYYREGAPLQSSLATRDIPGVALQVTGQVLSIDCRTPLVGAELDIWQADGEGRYDNDGTFPKGGPMRLRGKLRSDASGAFSFRTVVPGWYLNGARYRPSHIHARVSAPGHRPLTTQLYFPDDPYNQGDPFFRASLLMDIASGPSGPAAFYRFILAPA